MSFDVSLVCNVTDLSRSRQPADLLQLAAKLLGSVLLPTTDKLGPLHALRPSGAWQEQKTLKHMSPYKLSTLLILSAAILVSSAMFTSAAWLWILAPLGMLAWLDLSELQRSAAKTD